MICFYEPIFSMYVDRSLRRTLVLKNMMRKV